jgi:mono/diheme cytochrome c family protein
MVPRILSGCLVSMLLPLGTHPAATAASPPAASEAGGDYMREVKPILQRACVSCHGPEKPRGGLRLDTAAAILRGGEAGPAVVPGNPDESPLLEAVLGVGTTDRMPLNRPPLGVEEIEALRRWIAQGAESPADEPPLEAPAAHWAFVAPKAAAPPAVAATSLVRNAIDRFILARLEAAGLTLAEEAERSILLRRVSLDLTGLPPTLAEQEEFLNDSRPDAYERLVDRLLASPHFGERWGRLWLDQARYADSNGFNIDAPRSIWKYREWVIGAFNADLPFDQFVIDQIAGDLRPDAGFAERIATGFHRNTPLNQEGGIDVEQFRIESVVDRVNTTGTVFLGLSVGCAQCHDHKYDPITQREYFQLFAFFNNVDEPELEIATPEQLAQRAEALARIDRFHHELAARHPDLEERERAWEATLDLAFKQVQGAVARVAFDTPREQRSQEQRRALVELMLANHPDYREEGQTLAELQSRIPRFVTTLVVQERAGQPRITHIHQGGDFTRPGEAVTPGVPAVLPALPEASSTHRPDRLDLANWLVSRENPLTARVAVNRIWQNYFGRGLVETENDFGTQGSPPSHPELLDSLACFLMERGWRLKPLHRLIVTSATYRQASRSREAGQAIDPDNRLLWRQARLRLDAELIRDSALACSGLLTRWIGGPSVFPPQPEGVMTLGQMNREWKVETGPNRYRRGLYTHLWRATPYPFLTTFDAPSAVQTCTRRLRSNTPLQALTLLNDPAMVEIAAGLAQRLLTEVPGAAEDAARIDRGFRICLGRPPSEFERETLLALVGRERLERAAAGSGTGSNGSPASGADHEIWLAVARVLLNLDEFVTRE